MVFPVVMYWCENCTINEAEWRRIDAFELWCCRILFRVPWTAKRSNQSILKAKRSMNILATWYKSWLIGKDPDAGKDWRQEEKGATEDEIVKQRHRLSGHEFGQTPGDTGGQRSLACCSPSDLKELDTTEWLNTNCIPRAWHRAQSRMY